MKTLRDRIKQLTDLVTTLTEERNAARGETADLQAKVEDLTTRLARSDVRRALLEKEVSAASLKRLELLSQLKNDESRRLTALTSLRQPGVKMGLGVAAGGSPRLKRLNVGALSPLPVAKSPSESFLINLQPNLEPDSSDDEVDLRQLEATRKKLESRMKTTREKGLPVVDLGKAAFENVEDDKATVNPNEDCMQPIMTHPNKTIAAAVQDNADDAIELVVRAETSGKKDKELTMLGTAGGLNMGPREVKSQGQRVNKVQSSAGAIKIPHETIVRDAGIREENESLGDAIKLSEGEALGEEGSREGIVSSVATTNPTTGMSVGDGGNWKEAVSTDTTVILDKERNGRNEKIQEGATLPNEAAELSEDTVNRNEENGGGVESVGEATDRSIQNPRIGEIREEDSLRGEAIKTLGDTDNANRGEEENAFATDKMAERSEDMNVEGKKKVEEVSSLSEAATLAESMEEAEPVMGADNKDIENSEEVAKQDETSGPAKDTHTKFEEDRGNAPTRNEVFKPPPNLETDNGENRRGEAEQNKVFEPVGSVDARNGKSQDGTAVGHNVSEPAGNTNIANLQHREEEAAQMIVSESAGTMDSGNRKKVNELAAVNEMIVPAGDIGIRDWDGGGNIKQLGEATELDKEVEMTGGGNRDSNGVRDIAYANDRDIVPSARTRKWNDIINTDGTANSSPQKVGTETCSSSTNVNVEEPQNVTTERGLQESEDNNMERDLFAQEVFNTSNRGSLRIAGSTNTNQFQLSIDRIPWMDALNPRLQTHSSSRSLQEATHPDFLNIPGIISSAMKSSREIG